MTQAPPHVPLNGSRLVRFLSQLALSDGEVSHQHFTERLGRLIDLPDSIALSAAQAALPALAFEPTAVSGEKATREFVRERTAMLQFISNSFCPNRSSGQGKWLKLPTLQAAAALEGGAAYEPYLRFYATHQREIEFKIRSLRSSIRTAISGHSPTLAQLCALDTALEDALSAQSRRLFAVVPKLFKKRFEHLYQDHLQTLGGPHEHDDPELWLHPGGWLAKFCSEMQGLLLAELEVRLQPSLGLIEALNKEGDRGL